jgi:serine/threonine protein kinase
MENEIKRSEIDVRWYICSKCSLIYYRRPGYTEGCEKCGTHTILTPLIGKFLLQCSNEECNTFYDPTEFTPSYTAKALKCDDVLCEEHLKLIPIGQKTQDKNNIPEEEYGQTIVDFKKKSSQKSENQEIKVIQAIKPTVPVKMYPGPPQNGTYLECNNVYYKIIEEIAQGGMGKIYLAEHWQTQEFIVVKYYMYSKFHDNAENVNHCEKYWLKEQEIVGIQALSPNPSMDLIGAVKLELGSEPEYYILLEYIDGLTLDDWFFETYSIPEKSIFSIPVNEICFLIEKILMPLCKHLHYIHQFGIIHRDLTPQNIIIVDDDSPEAPYPIIIDWGVSQKIGLNKMYDPPKNYYCDATSKGTQIFNSGTPPEVIAGLKALAATDIYMVGSIMYFLFTGGAKCVMATTMQEYILHPSYINEKLPVMFDILVEKMTQYQPAERMETLIKAWESMKWLLENHTGAQTGRKRVQLSIGKNSKVGMKFAKAIINDKTGSPKRIGISSYQSLNSNIVFPTDKTREPTACDDRTQGLGSAFKNLRRKRKKDE